MFRSLNDQENALLNEFMQVNGFGSGFNEPNNEGILPLHAALNMSANHDPSGLKILRILLSQGANPSLECSGGDTYNMNAAGYAAANGLADSLFAIAKKYPDKLLSLTGTEKRTIIELAIMYSDRHHNFNDMMDKAKIFMNLNAKCCHVDADIVSPVIFAAANDRSEAVRWFMQQDGVSLDAGIPSCPGWNVLNVARFYGFEVTCNVILQERPDLSPLSNTEVQPDLPSAVTAVSEKEKMQQKIEALKAKKAAMKATKKVAPEDSKATESDVSTTIKTASEASESYIPATTKITEKASVDVGALVAVDYTTLMRATGGDGHGVKPWAEVKALMRDCDINAKLPPEHKDAGKTAFYFACQPFKGADPESVALDNANRVKAALEFVGDDNFDYDSNNYIFKAGARDVTFSAFRVAMVGNATKVLDALWEKFGPFNLEETSSTKTYLQWAAQGKMFSSEIFKWLVDHDANLNVEYNIKLAGVLVKSVPLVDLCSQRALNPAMEPSDAKTIISKVRSILNSDRLDLASVDKTGFTVMHYLVKLVDTRAVHDAYEKYPMLVTGSDMYGKTPLQVVADIYPTANLDTKNTLNAIAVELLEHGANATDIAGIIDLTGVDIHACHRDFVSTYNMQDLTYAANRIADDLMNMHLAGQHE